MKISRDICEMKFIDSFIADAEDSNDVSKQEETIQKLKEFGEKISE